MSLVDSEAVVLDLRERLLQRPSWGSAQIRQLLDEFEVKHRIDPVEERAFLRRFGSHLTDSFFGLLPNLATDDPLTAADPVGTDTAMDDGADHQSNQMEVPCQPQRSSSASRPSPPMSGSRRASLPSSRTALPTSS